MYEASGAFVLLEGALQRALRAIVGEPLTELAEYAVQGGKRLRGTLCLETAWAVGAAPERALPIAVAVELVHAASLLLDDLPSMDNAQTRRERPCLHIIYGVAAAELTAVALVASAFQTLCSAPLPAGACVASMERLAAVIGQMCLGQLVSSAETCPADEQKTASLFGYAARAGALAADRHGPVADKLESFGQMLGLAYQAFDDHSDALSRQDASVAFAALELHLRHARRELEQLPEGPQSHLHPWFRRFTERLVIPTGELECAHQAEEF